MDEPVDPQPYLDLMAAAGRPAEGDFDADGRSTAHADEADDEESTKAAARAALREQLRRMNKKIAVLHDPVGSILVEGGTNGFQLATAHDLEIIYANKRNPPKGGWVRRWLAWDDRREYTSITFAPGAPSNGAYNLWRGWGVTPAPPGLTIDLFWNDLVRDVICNGDDTLYQYVKYWMAHSVQKPGDIPRVALLLHSKEGTGKGTLVDKWLAPIFGRHYFVATSLDNCLGHFNSHLGNAMLVFGNEAVWGGDKRQQGRLKALITDEKSDITQKHKDTITVANYKRWIFASNADHPLPVDKSDRRFVVCEVSDKRIGDHAFWRELEELRVNGGVSALMRDLLAVNLADYNGQTFSPEGDRPKTGLADYKMRSAPAFDQWLQDTLASGEIARHNPRHTNCYVPWDGQVLKPIMYDSYCAFGKLIRATPETSTAFWQKLRKILVIGKGDLRPRATTTRQRAVTLVDIADAREAFARYMGEDGTLWTLEDLDDVPPPCEDCTRDQATRNFGHEPYQYDQWANGLPDP